MLENSRMKKNPKLLTRDFRETVRKRAKYDLEFRRALLEEAVNSMMSGDVETGRSVIRNYQPSLERH